MVWRVVSRFSSLGGRQPVVSRGALYALAVPAAASLGRSQGDRDLLEEVERLFPDRCIVAGGRSN